MVHASKICVQGCLLGGVSGDSKERAKESSIGQGMLKCKAIEREASDNPTGSSRPGTTLQKLSQFEVKAQALILLHEAVMRLGLPLSGGIMVGLTEDKT